MIYSISNNKSIYGIGRINHTLSNGVVYPKHDDIREKLLKILERIFSY